MVTLDEGDGSGPPSTGSGKAPDVEQREFRRKERTGKKIVGKGRSKRRGKERGEEGVR